MRVQHIHSRSRRGSVLVTALWIILALVAVVLVLCRDMTVEHLAAANRISQAKVDAAELGEEQYILGAMELEQVYPGTIETLQWQQKKIGDCYVWVIRPNRDDETVADYGLTDEASKWDLNTVNFDEMSLLPNMDLDTTLAASILNWRTDPNSTATAATNDLNTALQYGGATDNDYSSLVPPYVNKGAPFESTEELALVKGFTPDLLWGYDSYHRGWVDDAQTQGNQGANFQSATSSILGLYHVFTVYGVRATNPPATQPSSSTTGGIQLTNPVQATNSNVIIPADVNNTAADTTTGRPALSDVLTQYLPAKATTIQRAMQTGGGGGGARGGGGATATTYKSIWDWAVKVQLNSQDLTAVYPYVTCNPKAATGGGTGGATAAATQPTAKLNIVTASRAALLALPVLTENDIDNIIAQRDLMSADPTNNDPTNIGWLLDVIQPNTELNQAVTSPNGITGTQKTLGELITGKSTCYSADIVVVSGDGRMFKRVRVVVDAAMTPIQIIYRKDITDVPFPLPAEIRTALRSGQPLDSADAGSSRAARNNGLSMGIR